MAYRGGKPVGRIAGFINHHEMECWNKRVARFGWIDFIDDQELHATFIHAGIKFARTQPQLEDNLKAVSIWKNYESRIYIRRRVWTAGL